MGAAGAEAAQKFSPARFYDTFVQTVYDFLGLGPVPDPETGDSPCEPPSV